jgi:hypothetical protein
LEPLTNETEFGLPEQLPTPQASDYITKKTSSSWKAKGGVNFSLANPEIQAKWIQKQVPDGETFFHTPNTTGLDGGSNSRKALKKRMLPTPTASMMPCEGTVRIMRKQWLDGEFTLEEASAIAGRDIRKSQGKVPMWPTPIASRGGAWRADGQVAMVARNVDTYEEYWALTQGTSKKKREKYWPTPCQRDYKGKTISGERVTKSGKTQKYGDTLPNVAGGKLNPTWVEWLMGWPLGWTDLKPLETDKFQKWLDAHGKS